MLRLVVVFALATCAFAGVLPGDLDGRIVNGEDTTIEAHPYQVSLQSNDGFHFCGASIINEDTVITAAHCMQKYKATEFKVRLGTTYSNQGGEIVAVKSFSNHPGYNSKTKDNDVSIIKLATPVRESAKVRFVALAEKTPATGTRAVVTGWGTKCFLICSSPVHLQRVEVSLIDRKDCSADKYKYGSQITNTMVCAADVKQDACQGDSGGPLVAEGKLVGVVSWGNGCARAAYPGVYADVPALRKWIDDTVANL